MQENEFEKRLQEEMSEFRVRPSEFVWNRIADELRKKKRRRVIFYLFLLTGISVIGYSGYVLFTPQKPNLTEYDTAKTEINKQQTQQPSTADDANKAGSINENSEQPNQSIKTENGRNSDATIPNINDHQPAQQNGQGDDGSGISEPSAKTSSAPSKNKRVTSTDKSIAPQIKKEINRVAEIAVVPPPYPAQANMEANEQVSPEKKQINANVADSAATAIKKQEEKIPPVPQPTKKTKSNIRWALEVSGGLSQLSNKAFSFAGVNQQADALYSNAPGNNTGGNNVTVYYPPSEVVHGAAFRAAVVGEFNISKRSSFSGGLGYAYYSNEIKTGIHKDSSFVLRTMADQSVPLSSYYQGSQSQSIEYKNKYHFIQVPINYQLRLNKGVKTPIIWKIGVSPAFLFSTNALVYDTASGGIYYKNKDAFNKFHFNLNTGFSLRIGKPNKLQWSVGPEISMDMTGLTKDSAPANASSIGSSNQKRYFIYGGITGRIYFKKKNTK